MAAESAAYKSFFALQPLQLTCSLCSGSPGVNVTVECELRLVLECGDGAGVAEISQFSAAMRGN